MNPAEAGARLTAERNAFLGFLQRRVGDPDLAEDLLQDAFARALERVDAVLERLAVLWSNTEVIFDNLLQKSEHIEQFLEYSAAATSPERRIMGRFHQRLAEYKMFWLKVRDMAHATLHK